ncbi:hypothetical protein J1N35_005557 [Gossypium stocksii]|uniref:Uncharacterized protein n=1 Tax=Gossypium stocksii TaxID=47602 RepID=A0A9D3WE50_9ROSI|nr:hypothetical protein J1N35_005557 [Gossypium stocksii]
MGGSNPNSKEDEFKEVKDGTLEKKGSLGVETSSSVKIHEKGESKGCSLACFKTHKETPCMKPESVNEKSGANPGFQVERKLEFDDPSEVLQIMQMQAIASSNEVREALKDEHLQKLISNIDSSPDALNVNDIIHT